MDNDTSMTESQMPELDSMMLIIKSFLEHLEYTLGKDKYSASPYDLYDALAYSVRDRLIERWLDTQQAYYNLDNKRVYYISMEFLMGRTLGNSLINLGLWNDFLDAISSLGYDFEGILAEEQDAGLAPGDVHDPVHNVRMGVRYLGRMVDAFGDVDLGLIAYNAGPTRLSSYLQAVGEVPDSLWAYVRRVRREERKIQHGLLRVEEVVAAAAR